jgi:hypothetical protein
LKDGLGALGGFVTIYLRQGTDIEDVFSRLAALDGIDGALARNAATSPD